MKDYAKATPTIREKRMAEAALIPMENRPHCSICGTLIPYDGSVSVKRYMGRNCCAVYHDHKETKCFSVKIKRSNAARQTRKAPNLPVNTPCPHQKKKINAPVKEKNALNKEEADRLDREQAEINKVVHATLAAHCGYCNSPVRRLTREEIDLIAPTLTPPGNVDRSYNPHFRSTTRRGVEL